jgi:hypothetical protein
LSFACTDAGRTRYQIASLATGSESAANREPSGGYTALPNALLRVWIPALSGAETSLLMWVIQDTLAWHRDTTKPATYRLIARQANVHRHSIERAVAVLAEIGLICVHDADGNAGAYAQVFTPNSLLLQNPPLEFEALVQKLDQLRSGDSSKKGTDVVQERDTVGTKNGPMLVQKRDPSYKEESKELKESKKLASCDAAELEEEIRERIARSRLAELGGNPLDDRTVANIRKQIERLADDWQAKEVLETMEYKCVEFARNPQMAQTWGLVVTVVRDAVKRVLASAKENTERLVGSAFQKPWFWMTAEERTAVRETAEKIA